MKLIGPINHWRADPSGWIGSVIMLIFSGIAAWRWHYSGLVFYVLTFLRDIAAAWFLLSRREDSAERNFGRDDVLAYLSSAMPFVYLGRQLDTSMSAIVISDSLAVLGFGLATVALFELGSAFGVSPANRGRIQSGVYRYFRHPMYFGYFVAELGLCFLNPSNLGILPFSSLLYLYRAKCESAALASRS